MKLKVIAGIVLTLFLASTLTISLAQGQNEEIKLLWDDGHGQYHNSERCSSLISNLAGQGVMVDAVSTELNASLLSSYSILVITNPDSYPLSPDEISAVAQFVQGGGGIILTGDAQYGGYTFGKPDYLNAVLEGLRVADKVRFWGTNDCGDEIYDNASKILNWWQVAVNSTYFNPRAIAAGIQRVAIYSASLNVTESDIVVATSPPTSLTMDVNDVIQRSGSIPWLAALEVGAGKVVICGSSKMFSDREIYGTGQAYITYEDNEKLFFNFVWWMLGKLKGFVVTYGGETYCVNIFSNSTITDFNFSQPLKQVSFNVTGPDDTSGFCNITVLNSPVQDWWHDNYTVLVDGEQPLTIRNWTDGTYTYMYFTYLHSEHKVEIIPEFPTWTSMLLILIVLTVTMAIYRRRLFQN